MFKRKKNSKGFTLVELLVVIAIIGILAIVAVPSLFKNINKAKASEAIAYVSSVKSAAVSSYAEKTTVVLNDILDDVEDKPKDITVTSISIGDDGKWTINVTVPNKDIGDKLEEMDTDDTNIVPSQVTETEKK